MAREREKDPSPSASKYDSGGAMVTKSPLSFAARHRWASSVEQGGVAVSVMCVHILERSEPRRAGVVLVHVRAIPTAKRGEVRDLYPAGLPAAAARADAL